MTEYKWKQFLRRLVLIIFGAKVFGLPFIYKARIFFYRKCFNIGISPIIEDGVWIKTTHGFNGKITIGNHVLLARNSFIDYTGEVIIEDNVLITDGVKIYSHIHTLNNTIQTKVVLKRGCLIGTNAIILPNVSEIGEHSVVGAGSVVTRSIPAGVIVAGNPAKIIKTIYHD